MRPGRQFTVYTDDTYSWSQDPAGNPYISTKGSLTDPGTGNQQSATSTQTLDQYGNVTQSVIYPFNNTSTPLRTYNSVFKTDSSYISNYVRDRLVSTTLTTGGVTKTLVSNTYFTYGNGQPVLPYEMDQNPPIPYASRGWSTRR